MDIDHNTHCYKMKKHIYVSGIFDKSIDATYVIHLKDNGRLPQIQEGLREYQSTKVVYVVYNDGFKKCDKKLIEQVSYQDLTDAFLQCFKHANQQNYQNILILEDDFIFSPDVKNAEHYESVNLFLNEKKKRKEEFIYYLGCNPILIRPCTYDLKHYLSYKSTSTHAIVYSRETRNKMSQYNLRLKHWDVIIENSIKNRYLYYKPLCYQTYPDTENKESWGEKDSVVISYAKDVIIKTLNLHNQPEPGFSILYAFAKYLCFLVMLIWFITFLVILFYFTPLDI